MNVADQAAEYLKIRTRETVEITEDTRSREVFDDIAAARAAAVPPTEEYLQARAKLGRSKGKRSPTDKPNV